MLRRILPVVALLASGCGAGYGLGGEHWATEHHHGGSESDENHEAHEAHEAHEEHHHHDDGVVFTPEQISAASNILILETTHLERPAEVVGIVDAHAEMGGENAALSVLRARAAAMGANAVVGVEFHHGEGHGEPTHLSGMAVRFVSLGQ